jgi:hypothetical protein
MGYAPLVPSNVRKRNDDGVRYVRKATYDFFEVQETKRFSV